MEVKLRTKIWCRKGIIYKKRVFLNSMVVSVCQLNPVFGQGMTLALQSAEMLGEFLEAGSMESRQFQKRLHERTKFPWLIATLDPYNQATTSSWSRQLWKSVLYQIIKKAKSNAHMHHSLVEVLHMLASPKRLLALRHLS